MVHWVERWHGEKWPLAATVAQGSTNAQGGSTSMSTGVTNALSNKADISHAHTTAQITNLDSTLAGLAAAISTKAAGSHTHPQSDITGLTSTLANLSTSMASITSQLSTKASLSGGLVPTSQLGSGTANNTTFLRGDQTYATPTAVASGVIPSTWAVASTHVLTGSTTMQSVTDLGFSVSSASVYRFEFITGWQTTSSAAGIALGVNGPAAPTLLAWEAGISTGMGGLLTRAHNSFGAQQIAVPQSSAANVTNYGYLGGVVRTGANAGTLQLQFASEVSGSTVSVRAGSVGFLFGPL